MNFFSLCALPKGIYKTLRALMQHISNLRNEGRAMAGVCVLQISRGLLYPTLAPAFVTLTQGWRSLAKRAGLRTLWLSACEGSNPFPCIYARLELRPAWPVPRYVGEGALWGKWRNGPSRSLKRPRFYFPDFPESFRNLNCLFLVKCLAGIDYQRQES